MTPERIVASRSLWQRCGGGVGAAELDRRSVGSRGTGDGDQLFGYVDAEDKSRGTGLFGKDNSRRARTATDVEYLLAGLGIGQRAGAAEAFGVVTMGSVFPIIAVLLSGFLVAARRKSN